MKSRSLLVFVLILSLAVVPSLQLALAASSTTSTTSTTSTAASSSPFSQRLDVYTAGSNDIFLITLSPVNATKPALVSAESVPGVTAYQITVIKSTGASPSSQLFWNNGYKVLKIPFVPDQGVFVNITASSQSAAQSAATNFDNFLGTNLVLIGSGGGNYTYFAPEDFGIGGDAIFSFVPAAEKGLASLFTATTLLDQPSPTIVLTGVRSGSSFIHSVSYGSTNTHVVASNGTFALGSAWNLSANQTFTASSTATSTTVNIHSLDGLISSPDAAKITNHNSNFSGTYSIGVSAGAVFKPNVTILSDPPVLSVTRTIDKGSASSGDLVTVSLLFTETAGNKTQVNNIALNDNWWTNYPSLFSLTAGNSSMSVSSLGGGQSVSRDYVLKVASSASENIVIPAATTTYSYAVGNVTVSASTQTNQVELRTNNPGPDMELTASPSIASGSPIGTAGQYAVTVTNVGSSPALDLKVGSSTNPTLLPGASWKVNTTIPLATIVGRNLTQSFTLGWTLPDGTQASLVSNPANVVLSHSGILIPFMQFELSSTPSSAAVIAGKLNATYTLSNVGSAPGNATVSQTFPSGMTCKDVVGNSNGTAACTSSSAFTLAVVGLKQGGTVTGTIQVAFGRDNYIAQPGVITTTVSALTLVTEGTGYVVPAGISLQKSYSVNPVFQGENDTINVKVTNVGSLPIINATVSTIEDQFDTTASGSPNQVYPTLAPGASENYSFVVHVFLSGNQSTGAASVSYAFGGFQEAYTAPAPYVLVYKPVHASVSLQPATPSEGKDFVLSVDIGNPAALNVTNVSYSLAIPSGATIVNYSSGVQLSGRTISINLNSLGGGADYVGTVTLRVPTDGTVNLPAGTLSFRYLGDTILGETATTTITVGIDLLLRYEIPVGVAIVITLGVAFYFHRRLPPPQAK